ncbi:hypothetical protein ACIBQ1_14980 [Nonomuraea sp. NPDC050153]|uniref:hypothetical protein n=1 Tax=Nonomuraea sp. NPDC050153 TaxID=3364359 RepID=UPI0037A9DAA1
MPTYTLDGVPLDHPGGCWQLKLGTKRRPLPGIRGVSLTVPGRHGEIPIHGLDLEATMLPLACAVYAYTPSGTFGGYEQMERNLEAITALLGVRHRPMQLRYEAGSIVRIADVTVDPASEVEINVGTAIARFTSVVKVPGVVWRDEVETTWAGSASALNQPVTTLAGSTGPISDAIVRITGPAVNPSVSDVATGGTVARGSGLLTGERLLIDCGQMRARLVITDTWDLSTGTDATGQISATGPGSAFRWLHLTPSIAVGDPHSRTVMVTSSATSTTGASRLEIRSRRSYL